jgi:hypothetical protein
MSEWTEQFESHAIHESIRSALAAVTSIPSGNWELDTPTTEKLERIRQVLLATQSRIASVDPALVPMQVLQQLVGPIQKIEQGLSTFESDGKTEQINLGHNQLENVLVATSNIPVPVSANEVESIREAVTALRRSIGQNSRRHEDQVDEIDSKLQAITKLATEIEKRLGSSEKQIATTIESAQEQIVRQIQKIETSAGTAETDRNELVEEFLAAREKSWDGMIKEKREEYDTVHESISEKFDELNVSLEKTASEKLGELDKKSETILTSLTDRRAEAEKIVGVITDTGMIGGYQREANSARWAGTFWRIMALLALLGLIGFAITIFILGVTNEDPTVLSWPIVGWRVFVATAFGLLAAYSARQADKHDQTRRRYRKMELELASISPYLHDVPEEKMIEIKMELAKKMFGQVDQIPAKSDKQTTGTLTDVIEMAMDTIKTISSK